MFALVFFDRQKSICRVAVIVLLLVALSGPSEETAGALSIGMKEEPNCLYTHSSCSFDV